MIVPFIAVTRYFVHNKCRPGGLQKKCLLLNHSIAEKYPNYSLRNFFRGVHEDLEKFFPSYRRNSLLVIFWTKHLPMITRILKFNSVNVAKDCLQQIEFVVAHRIRRGQQMITLYSSLWNEKAVRFFFQRMKCMLQKKGKQTALGVSLVAFNWDKERITDEELKSHVDEMKICKILRTKALDGDNRNHESVSVEPECLCSECLPNSTVVHMWEPFIIEEDMTVWKMPGKNHKKTGLYCYKLYGKYDDVAAEDFLQVFLDTENRTKWDTHAANLKVIETDPDSQSEVIYWETRWPTLFSNRDYVFKRRYYRDEQKKVLIVINKSTEHPLYPPTTKKARVTEYWSYMVIKATDDLSEPGMEFSLTYFDNPGISLPSAISLWVTVQGMPEYLKRLRIEALAIGERKRLERIKEAEQAAIKAKEGFKPPSPPSTDSDIHLSTIDLVLIFSSSFQKLRTLWL